MRRSTSYLTIAIMSLCSSTVPVFLLGCGGIVRTATSPTLDPLVITTTNLGNANVSMTYQQTLVAAGGTPPYSWRVTGGTLPAGLALASTGTISGTPTTAGSFTFSVQVADATAATQTATFTLTVAAGLTITTTTLAGGSVGSAYQAALVAAGGSTPYTWSITAGSLPAGLSLASSGTITGTPMSAGSSTLTVQVTDAKSATKTGTLSITVTAALKITTTSLPAATVGVAYQQNLTASGGQTPYTWRITSGSLPSGLSLATGGTISGTPTAGGSFTFTVQVADAASATKTASLTLTVSSLTITTTSLPSAVVGSAYQTTLAVTGGTAPYTWAMASGSLPAGLSLASNGSISGTPTTAGSSNFSVQVADAAAATMTASFTLTVAAGLTITTTNLAGGSVGSAYQTALVAAGGSTPYTWSITAGTLPAGLSLASNGTISGTPTTAGSSIFSVQVADATAATKTATFTLTVNDILSITTAGLAAGIVGSPYSQNLLAAGGKPPYTWILVSGSLPTALSLASSGTISGTPTAAGAYSFTVQVQDTALATKTAPFTVNITTSSNFQYTLGDSLYPYSTQSAISKGQSYTDATFHVPVTRITDGTADLGLWGMTTNYSTWNPLSSDGAYLLLMGCDTGVSDCSHFVVYNATSHAVVLDVSSILLWWDSQDPEPRWDRTGAAPHRFYYRKDMQLRYYDVDTRTDGLYHDFAADAAIKALGITATSHYIYTGQKGNNAIDGRYWAMIACSMTLQGTIACSNGYIFTWDAQANQILAAYRIPSNECPHELGISPWGDHVEVGNDYGSGCGAPYTLDVATLTSKRLLGTNLLPHGMWARTKQGHTAFVSQNNSTDYMQFMRPDTGDLYDLYYYADFAGPNNPNWNGLNMLHAFTSQPGWGFISEYGEAGWNTQSWPMNQIFAMELDETKYLNIRHAPAFDPVACSACAQPRIWRIAWTQNTIDSDYYFEQPNAAMDYSGTRIWFTSNWRTAGGKEDVYEVELPATWLSDLANLP